MRERERQIFNQTLRDMIRTDRQTDSPSYIRFCDFGVVWGWESGQWWWKCRGGWELERKGSLSRLKGNFQNHVDSKSKVNQRLFRRWRGMYWWREALQPDPALKIKKRHNSASIWKVLYPSDRSWRERSERERERERIRKVGGGGEFHRLFHLVLCIGVTNADWEILRTEINQCRDRFSPCARSRVVSAYICLHLNLWSYETWLEHWILSGSET